MLFSLHMLEKKENKEGLVNRQTLFSGSRYDASCDYKVNTAPPTKQMHARVQKSLVNMIQCHQPQKTFTKPHFLAD